MQTFGECFEFVCFSVGRATIIVILNNRSGNGWDVPNEPIRVLRIYETRNGIAKVAQCPEIAKRRGSFREVFLDLQQERREFVGETRRSLWIVMASAVRSARSACCASIRFWILGSTSRMSVRVSSLSRVATISASRWTRSSSAVCRRSSTEVVLVS